MMRLSQHFGKTLRDAPADATMASHALIVRAGLAKPLASGIWSYLPLGWRVIRRIEAILRREMDRISEEMHMPLLHPAELWQATGRWHTYGEALQRAGNREGRWFVLGPTHEEVVTDLAKREVESYKDLPRAVYQIQTKIRDEARARGGLIRMREFMMKDAYSLHADYADLDAYYTQMYRAYEAIFRRCDLDVIPIEADTGQMGGSVSHEFTLPHSEGEDRFVHCIACGYAANIETAQFSRGRSATGDLGTIEKVATPDCKTIADLCTFLNIKPQQTLKAVFYTLDKGTATERTIITMLRGDLDVNETKLLNAAKALTLEAATEDEIRSRLGAEPGYASPIGLNAEHAIGDQSLQGMTNFVTGANEAGYHTINANTPRDFAVGQTADIAEAYDGAECSRCGSTLHIERAIELGHCFKLGIRYSNSLDANYIDANGDTQPIVMGSYGIGLDRLMAAIIETHHDAQGILWPAVVAPFDVHLVAIAKNDTVIQAAEQLYESLQQAGIEVLYDDRSLSPGVMFSDADLIGVPLRITISPRSIESGGIEVKWRSEEGRTILPLEKAVEQITDLLHPSS
jgi:prolyl-tRNA synthetase